MQKKIIAQSSEDKATKILNDLATQYDIKENTLLLAFNRLKAITDDASSNIATLRFIFKEMPETINEARNLGADYIVEIARNPHYLYLKNLSKNEHCTFNYEQLKTIYNNIRESNGFGTLTDLTVIRTLHEMKWWLADIGLPEDYISKFSLDSIAKHILVNRLYEIEAKIAHGSIDTYIKGFTNGETLYIGSKSSSAKIEKQIAENHEGKSYYVSAYKTKAQDVIIYIVKEESPLTIENNSYICNAKVSDEMADKYLAILGKQDQSLTPIINRSNRSKTNEVRLMVSFPDSSAIAFTNIENIMDSYGISVNSKYFHNITTQGPCVYTLYLSASDKDKLNANMKEIIRDINNIAMCKASPFTELISKDYSADRALVSTAVAHFVHFFITKNHPENIEDPKKAASPFQQKLDHSEFPFAYVEKTLLKYPELTKLLYEIFITKYDPAKTSSNTSEFEKRLNDFINDDSNTNIIENERIIYKFAQIFLNNINSTNFFMPNKSAISFKMNPEFLSNCRYDQNPFGVFFVIGKDFQGFHTRFKDIARGGIRLVLSKSLEMYMKNLEAAYREGFGLAAAQDLKNKDIPEGGSKGIILAEYGISKEKATIAFKQYFDSLLDLILPQNSEMIKDFTEDILFFGPDENTADLMDWACERAEQRGYNFWKSSTTGKKASLGGVSHIDYGMTTTSVHEFTKLILEAKGLNEKEVTKFQTGGPDGDLGSNEIHISKDKTIGIADGAGVLYDPEGLNREELTRLALLRLDISHFDRSKLGTNGFLVLTSDKNIILPNGEKVSSGTKFRDEFHLNPLSQADIFVPCGGRPKSINMSNVGQLLIDGKPKHQIIVEGANLFLTQEAREFLESKGVIIIKDSTANKGGVTSSAMEVLAGLALTNEEFQINMTAEQTADIRAFRLQNIEQLVKDSMNDQEFSYERLSDIAGQIGEIPKFRTNYIKEIIQIIKNNARLEFNALWKAYTETGKKLSILSDELSRNINKLSTLLDKSELFENVELRKKVLLSYIPKSLSSEIGIDKLMQRIPLNYQKAIFCKELARQFVYTKGVDATPEDYRKFINNF